MSKKTKKPRIILWDLETLPDPKQIYKNVPSIGAWPGRTFKAELQSVMCFGYKVYGEKRTHCINAWDFKDWKKDRHNDKQLVTMARDILNEADAIVTHNGKSFDYKVLNTRLAKHGLAPLPKKLHIDTKIVAKRGLSLYSNSLANVAKFFGVADKMTFNNKWGMWERIAFKEETKKDLKVMSDYCKMDVIVLEAIYDKLRPHATSIPNYNIFDKSEEGRKCPNCGSDKLHKHGTKVTPTKIYQRYLCQSCGTTSRTDTKDKNAKVG